MSEIAHTLGIITQLKNKLSQYFWIPCKDPSGNFYLCYLNDVKTHRIQIAISLDKAVMRSTL